MKRVYRVVQVSPRHHKFNTPFAYGSDVMSWWKLPYYVDASTPEAAIRKVKMTVEENAGRSYRAVREKPLTLFFHFPKKIDSKRAKTFR